MFLNPNGSEHQLVTPARSFTLIALPFKCAHIAAASALLVGTRPPTLIGCQQMTLSIGAAIRVARVNRWASFEQLPGLGRAAVVLQEAQVGFGVVQIASVAEVAGAIAARL